MIRRPQLNVQITDQAGRVFRSWGDFFMDIWHAFKLVKGVLCVDATIDFGSTAAHSTSTSNVTVAGARTNDVVDIGLPATVDAGMQFDGHVSADDTVTVRAVNTTGGAIDPASATYRIMVTRIAAG